MEKEKSLMEENYGSSGLEKQIKEWQESSGVLKDTFAPAFSGSTNRLLYRSFVRSNEASAEDQAMFGQIKNAEKNYNNYIYARTAEFPQPSIAGIGAVTAAGARDTTRYFFSQNWVVSKPGTGSYTITHNLGDNKYNVFITPISTTGFTACIGAFNNNDFNVRTFNSAGVATDCAFTFIVYIIP